MPCKKVKYSSKKNILRIRSHLLRPTDWRVGKVKNGFALYRNKRKK